MNNRRWVTWCLERVAWLLTAYAILESSRIQAHEPDAAPQLHVELASGRAFTGYVDARTSADELWLRIEGRAVQAIRPIAWSAIATAKLGESSIEIQALRQRVEELKTVRPRRKPKTIDDGSTPAETNSLLGTWSSGVESEPALFVAAPVAAVQVQAEVANWDADAECDGLLATVTPIDEFGRPTLTEGHVELELIATGPLTLRHGRSFPITGRWVRQLVPQAVHPSGFVFKLDFQASHPDFDLRVGPLGLMHARLVVPGRGTFEASTHSTSIRTFDPLRDQLQDATGQRFFPTETTGLGKRRMPLVGTW